MILLIHHESEAVISLSKFFMEDLTLREALNMLPKISAEFADLAGLDPVQTTDCIQSIVVGLPFVDVLPKIRALGCTLTAW